MLHGEHTGVLAATAHVPNYKGIRDQKQLSYVFGFPDPYLPIHYTTFMKLCSDDD